MTTVGPDDPGRFAGALLLLALAGAIDAVGFARLGGLFVSFMSGNTTQAAVALSGGRLADGGGLLGIVLSFVIGATLGDLMAGDPPRHAWAVLLVEVVLLLAATAFAGVFVRGMLLALAMGMHNALILRAARIGIALTYVTGTLVHVGRGIAAVIARRADATRVWPFAAMWTALLAGALAGGVLARVAGPAALRWLAGALLVVAVTMGSIDFRRMGR